MVSGMSDGQGQTEHAVHDNVRSSPSCSAQDRPSRRLASARNNPRPRGPGPVTRALANLVFTGSVVWLTYFVTTMLVSQPPAAEPIPEKVRIATQKTAELRAEERRLLTTYGPPGPMGGYRIPIDRAMELSAAEGGRPHLPPPMAAAATVSPGPSAPAAPATGAAGATAKSSAAGPVTTTAPAAVATTIAPAAVAAAPAPASNGMPPQQLFLAVCFACHGPDGRGTAVRAAMPVIPDFTDPKWQASRTDADLTHSILQGKGQLMLPMKDKLELAHTDVKDMVAFIRSFQPGRAGSAAPAVAAGPPASMASPAAPVLALTGPASVPPALTGLASPAPLAPGASATTPASPLAPPSLAPIARAGGAAPSGSGRAQIGGAFFNVNCIACHGPDGRGSAVRPAMPVIPDFTASDWQKGHQDAQLVVSILEGKGALMPAWRGRVDPDLARDLVAFVRTFGPAGLDMTGHSSTDFAARMNQLRQQWDDLDRQARALSAQ